MKEDKLTQAIKSRNDIEPARISLRKLLASDNMEHYLKLCSDRIAENERIDGANTQINFADFPDLLFNSDGLWDCRHILEDYLPADALMDAWQLLLDEERTNREVNSVAAAFRKMKWQDLLKYYIKWRARSRKEDAGQEVKPLVCRWITAELRSRSLFSRIWRKANRALTRFYVRVKYRRLFAIMRTAAEKHN